MTETVIAISGKQRAGKTHLAHNLKYFLPDYHITPIAEAIKKEYANTHNLSLEELERRKTNDPNVRGGLISLGREKRLQHGSRYWISKVIEEDDRPFKILDDLRFRDEIEYLEEKVDHLYLVRVNATRLSRSTRGLLSNEDDPTEVDLDTYHMWDFIFTNDGALNGATNFAEFMADHIQSRQRHLKRVAAEQNTPHS